MIRVFIIAIKANILKLQAAFTAITKPKKNWMPIADDSFDSVSSLEDSTIEWLYFADYFMQSLVGLKN